MRPNKATLKLRLQKNLRSASRMAAVPASATLAVLALTGCRGLDNHTAAFLNDTTKAHPISFSSETETLYVEVPADRRGLSRNQASDIRRFVERYKVEGDSNIKIAAPRASSRFAVAKSMNQVEDIIAGAGIPSEAVHQSDYSGHNGRYGPAIRIAYRRPVAIPPGCQDWSHDLAINRERLPYRDFGCATQRNLALNVANARDLQGPQYETPRSSERRSTTWTEYVKGDGEKLEKLKSGVGD